MGVLCLCWYAGACRACHRLGSSTGPRAGAEHCVEPAVSPCTGVTSWLPPWLY